MEYLLWNGITWKVNYNCDAFFTEKKTTTKEWNLILPDLKQNYSLAQS